MSAWDVLRYPAGELQFQSKARVTALGLTVDEYKSPFLHKYQRYPL